MYITPELDRALNAAEDQAKHMKDEYISVEHLFLGMLEAPNGAMKEMFKTFGITRDEFLKVLRRRPGRGKGDDRQPGGHLRPRWASTLRTSWSLQGSRSLTLL